METGRSLLGGKRKKRRLNKSRSNKWGLLVLLLLHKSSTGADATEERPRPRPADSDRCDMVERERNKGGHRELGR